MARYDGPYTDWSSRFASARRRRRWLVASRRHSSVQ